MNLASRLSSANMRGWVVGMAAAATITIATACSSGSGDGSDAKAPTRPTRPVGVLTEASHAVGVLTETFVDVHRPTAARGDNPGRPERSLVTTILYPATGTPGPKGPVDGATADRRGGPYPLIVFAHGLGTDPRIYTRLLRGWAAAGYVVAAPLFPLSNSNTPGGTDAADVVNQPGDVSFVVSSVLKASARTTGTLAGLVDPHAIGAAGHSNGAITTLGLVANTCCRDARLNAAVVLAGDPVAFPNGHYDYSGATPILLVHGTADNFLPYADIVAVFNHAEGPKGLLTIENGDHGAPAGLSDQAFSSVLRATEDFFAAFLRGDKASLARIPDDGQRGVTNMRFAPKLGSAVTIPTVPAPERDRHARVTPDTNLTNGQTVVVRWSGFTPGKIINIIQCAGGAATPDACAFTRGQILILDPTGAGSLPLEIVEGAVGNGVCDATGPNCVVAVSEASSEDPAATIRIPIAFAT